LLCTAWLRSSLSSFEITAACSSRSPPTTPQLSMPRVICRSGKSAPVSNLLCKSTKNLCMANRLVSVHPPFSSAGVNGRDSCPTIFFTFTSRSSFVATLVPHSSPIHEGITIDHELLLYAGRSVPHRPLQDNTAPS